MNAAFVFSQFQAVAVERKSLFGVFFSLYELNSFSSALLNLYWFVSLRSKIILLLDEKKAYRYSSTIFSWVAENP